LSRFNAFDLVQRAACFLDDKLAKHITVLDTRDVSSLADYFIIVSADSVTQVQAMTGGLQAALKDHHCLGVETDSQHHWHLVDYGDVIIHIMHNQAREFYQLDAFWNHATPVAEQQWRLKNAG
jgi:ribosome-associated protein